MSLLIAVIVVLITALVVLVIFGGGVENVQKTIGGFISGDQCQNVCNAYQSTCTVSKPYNQIPGCNDAARTAMCTCVKAAAGGG